MNLIIDIGNSSVKSAVFNNNNLVELLKFSISDFKKNILQLKSDYPDISKAIISSVGRLEEEQIDFIANKYSTLILNKDTLLPFINRYKTPNTLGADRLALVSGAVAIYPNQDVLIIDAGTCITYDFVDAEKNYYGGAISPGIRLRYQSLNNFTANLPLLETEIPKEITGDSTSESIHSGVVNGILFEIKGVVGEYVLKYPDLTVILTGGDAKFLSDQLKIGIFANSNFLLEGLNHILEYNKCQ